MPRVQSFRSHAGANFSYLLADPGSGEAALIDPSHQVAPYLEALKQQRLRLKYLLLTHGHRDHLEGVAPLRQELSFILAAQAEEKTLLRQAGLAADLWLDDGQQLSLGQESLLVLHTPGHTPGGACYLFAGQHLFTGDTIFINDSGRTDLPGGDAATIYRCAREKLLPLPDHLQLYPGHDYGPVPSRTLGEEKRQNAIFRCPTFEEFDRA